MIGYWTLTLGSRFAYQTARGIRFAIPPFEKDHPSPLNPVRKETFWLFYSDTKLYSTLKKVQMIGEERFATGHDKFTYKRFGRIYVQTEGDVLIVEGILKGLDEHEFSNYYPEGLVTTIENYPECIYTYKYEQNLDELKRVCKERKIPIFVLNSEYPESEGYRVTLGVKDIENLLNWQR
jgi:hypothetical protein